MTRGFVGAAHFDRYLAIVGLLGVVLVALNLVQVSARSTVYGVVVVAGVPLVLSLALLAGVVVLARRESGPDLTARVAAWVLIGVAATSLASLWLGGDVLTRGLGPLDTAFVVANNVTTGAAVGFLVGYYDAAETVERERLEQYRETLQKRRDRFFALFENVPTPVIYYRDADGPRVDAVNAAFESQFGLPADRVDGDRVGELLAFPEDDVTELTGGSGDPTSTVAQRRTDEGMREFRIYFVPLDRERADGHERGFALCVDVTEQRRRERRLELLNRVLRHDLRTEMNLISGSAERLTDAEAGGETARVADTIRDRALNVSSLADKARQLEETMAESTARRTVDFVAVVEGILADLRADHPGVAVETSLPDAAPVSGGGLAELALENLVENAVEHNDRAEPTVRVSIDVEDAPQGYVVVTVADDGPGVPEDELAIVERGEETPLEHTSGLGLWLASWVAEDVGGALEFSDNDPRGTVATLYLPRDGPEDETPPPA